MGRGFHPAAPSHGVERIDRGTEPTDAELLQAHRGGDAASYDAPYCTAARATDSLFL